ncbi:MAG: amino acid permease [Acidimicrobiales bacterium]|nr:amino acid permease [Acidimicrobiales bacterium]
MAEDAPAGPAGPVRVIDARRPPAGLGWPTSGILDLAATVPIGSISWRQRVQVHGRVRSLRVRPWGEVLTLEVVLVDETGGVTAVFPGRRRVPGIRPGTLLTVEGMVGARGNRLTVLNPHYDLRPFPV